MADTEIVVCGCCKTECVEKDALYDEEEGKYYCSLRCHSEDAWTK